MIISTVARFEGCLPREPLENALRILQQRHAALRVTIRDHGRAAHFVEASAPPPIPLTWSETDSLDQWADAASELGSEPFDVCRGPLVRVRVLHHHESNSSDVILASHHAVSDGRSGVVLYRELARLCAGETLPPATHSELRPVPRVPRRQGLAGPLFAAFRRRVAQQRRLEQYPLAEMRRPPQAAGVLQRRVWTAADTAKLRERARNERTTIFGALAAAAVLSLYDLHGLRHRSVRIRSPLDVRNLCEPPISGDPIGCYTAMLGFLLPGADRQSFWELARSARQEVQRSLDTGLWAAGWRLLGGLLRHGHMPPMNPIFCTLNNLGVIDDLTTRSARLLEYGWTVNQQQMSVNVMLAAATVQGALNLTLRSPWHSPAEGDALLDKIFQRLENACA